MVKKEQLIVLHTRETKISDYKLLKFTAVLTKNK